MDIKDVGTIVAVILSSSSLGITVWKEFFAGAKLETAIDQVALLRLSAGNKIPVLLELLLDDLLSPAPTQGAQKIMGQFSAVQVALQTGNRQRLAAELMESASKPPGIVYDPPKEKIERFISDARFALNFYIPLIVHNSGKRSAHISSLVLTAESVADSSKKWAFTAFTEVNTTALIHRKLEHTDADRMAGLFVGAAVAAGETIRIDSHFVPINDAQNIIISRGPMPPGEYLMRALGYGPTGERLFETGRVKYKLTTDMMVGTLLGGDSMILVNNDAHVADAIQSKS